MLLGLRRRGFSGASREPGVAERATGGKRRIRRTLVFPNVTTAVGAVLAASARAISHTGEEAVAVAAAIHNTLPRFTRPDGTVVWNNRFRWVKATRA
ncbi:MAG: hypothetical protein WB820_15290 [Rhodoplanes sp.]